jgi:predicted AlkP superfamily phosphohydrolase/phosphomutase
MQELNIVYKNIKELKPYKKNAKKHSKEQVEQIANSIKEFGFDTDMSDEELDEVMKEVKFKTKEKHLVIVPCKSEKETTKVQKEIEQLGYKCDVKNV